MSQLGHFPLSRSKGAAGELPENFPLHSDGTQQFGVYSGGPYISSVLAHTYYSTITNSTLRSQAGCKETILCLVGPQLRKMVEEVAHEYD